MRRHSDTEDCFVKLLVCCWHEGSFYFVFFFVMTCVTCVQFVGLLTVVGVFLKFDLARVDIVENPRITSSSGLVGLRLCGHVGKCLTG